MKRRFELADDMALNHLPLDAYALQRDPDPLLDDFFGSDDISTPNTPSRRFAAQQFESAGGLLSPPPGT